MCEDFGQKDKNERIDYFESLDLFFFILSGSIFFCTKEQISFLEHGFM